nr:MAG: hypothetical protein [Microvirus sp.]
MPFPIRSQRAIAAAGAPSPAPGFPPSRPSSGGTVIRFPIERVPLAPRPVPTFGPPVRPPNVPFGRRSPIPAGVVRGVGGRLASRLIPGLGAALTAWDLFQWARGITARQDPPMDGYTLARDCGYYEGVPMVTDLFTAPNCGTRFACLDASWGIHSARPLTIVWWWQDGTRYPPNKSAYSYLYEWQRWTRVSSSGKPQWFRPAGNYQPRYVNPRVRTRTRPRFTPSPQNPLDPNNLPHPIFDPYIPNPPVRPSPPDPIPVPRPVVPIRTNPGGWPQFREGGYDVRQRYGGSHGVRQREYVVPPIDVEIDIPVGPARPPRPGQPTVPGQAPTARPRVRNRSRIQPRSRTRADEKEKKVGSKSNRALGIIGRALGRFSETNDFVDALYGALPPHLRTANNFVDRGRILVEHFDSIDAAQAIQNLVANEIEDRIVGRAFGYQTAPGYSPANDLLRALGNAGF